MKRLDLKTKQKENRKRSEILKNWFSSLFMTVGVVIVVVAFVPRSPIASIDLVSEYSTEVLYQVSVTDEDSSILEDSLKIVLENQMEYYEHSLEVGKSSGIFNELSPSSEYTIKVLANKGFGLEVLASSKVKTADILGGGIVYVNQTSPFDSETLTYEVSTYTDDPFDEIEQFYLKVTYEYIGYDQYFDFATYPIIDGLDTIVVDGLYNQNMKVIFTVVGVSLSEETEFDSYKIQTPLNLYSSLYLVQVTDTQIDISAYAEFDVVPDLSYTLVLYQNNKVIEKQELNPPNYEENPYEESDTYLFNNLTNNTNYYLELIASYTDPMTLTNVETVLTHLEVTTLHRINYSTELITFDDHYEVVIEVDDPYDVFQEVSYYLYEVMDGVRNYSNYYYELLNVSGSVKTFTLVIDKPDFANYYIEVIISNTNDYSKHLILKEILPI
ncbi:MAG: hypothetical protein PHC62_08205 [Candidatus Izemoplasmatales bacterium]|nr:hypothetical protein [Candidatus Izemoplasmatales bacterium]